VHQNGFRAQDMFKLLGPDVGAPCRTTTCTATWSYDARGRVVQEVTGTGITGAITRTLELNQVNTQRAQRLRSLGLPSRLPSHW
jgi:hypothetical protein